MPSTKIQIGDRFIIAGDEGIVRTLDRYFDIYYHRFVKACVQMVPTSCEELVEPGCLVTTLSLIQEMRLSRKDNL